MSGTIITPIERVLLALKEQDCAPRGGGGQWSCKCPAHDDRRPSLRVGVGEDGRVLLHCLAGCGLMDVLTTLGLCERDLFSHEGDQRWARSDAVLRERKPFRRTIAPSRTYASMDEAIEAEIARRGELSNLWEYVNTDGVLTGAVARWDLASGKTIRPFALYPNGWAVAAMPSPRPLYRADYLAMLPAGAWVHVHEGEPAADAGWSMRLVSTTSPGGANCPHMADWSPLREKVVVIWPDHDDPGRGYADSVAKLALEAGADSVVVVDIRELWPDAPEGADFVDVVKSGAWKQGGES